MELWIRSQDRKRLTKATDIRIGYLKQIGWIIEDCDELGIYETEERALEVLDEIQRILQPKIIINNTSDDSSPIIDGEWVKSIKAEMNYDTKELSTVVYEMPKE